MTTYVKYEFVLGLISVGDFPSIYLRYNSQITKFDIYCKFVIFWIKSCYKMKQIMLSKVTNPISFLSSSKCIFYIITMYGFQFQNIIMIFINVVLAHVIN